MENTNFHSYKDGFILFILFELIKPQLIIADNV